MKQKKNILITGFNIDGAMGDNLKFMIENLSSSNEFNWFLLSKELKLNNDSNIKDKLFLNYKIKNIPLLIKEMMQMSKFIKDKSIDEIIILTPNLLYNSYLSLRFKNKVKAYFLHDPKPHTGEGFIRTRLLKLQNYVTCKSADRVIVASEYLKEEMIKNNYLSVDKNKIEVIYLGLLNNLKFDDIDYSKEETDILFFGRIEDYKGIDVLLKALEELNDESIKCKIIGKGDIGQYIGDKEFKNIEVDNSYVPDHELAEEIAKAKVVVFPYKNATGTQTVQICYYYGKCVVASNVGCFNDYVVNGKTGYVFENGDYVELSEIIRKVLEGKEERRRLREYNKVFLEEKFNTKNIINEYYHILRKSR